MPRLLFFLGALAVALFAQRVLRADEFAPYVLRDGLLLSAVAMILFAVRALPLSPLHPTAARGTFQRSPVSTMLLITGVLCGLASSALFATGASLFALAPLRTALWLVGIACLLGGGFWPRGGTGLGVLTHRWRRGEGGEFVRVPVEEMERETPDPAATARANEQQFALAPALEWALLALLTGLALALRLWDLHALPARCLGEECTRLVALAGVPGTVPWYATAPSEWLLQWILRGTEADVRALRLFGVLLGTLTLPVWYGFVRQFARPGGALAGAALLALSPWHLRASAGADPWIVLPLLIAVSGWMLLLAWRGGRLYASVLAALSWGLLLAEGATAELPLLLWLLLGCGIGALALRGRTPGSRLGRVALWSIGALAVAGPWLVHRWPVLAATPSGEPLGSTMVHPPLDLLTALLRGTEAGALSTVDGALLGALSAALLLLGIGTLLRWIYVPRSLFVLSGAVICTVAVLRSTAPPASAALLLLPVLYGAIAVALDQLVTAVQQAWRPVLPPQRVAVALPVLLLLLMLPAAWGTVGTVGLLGGASSDGVGSAMGRYLAGVLPEPQSESEGAAVYFIPPTLLNDAGLRAEIGPEYGTFVDAQILRPFDPVPALFFTPIEINAAKISYLVPVREGELLDLLARLYPGSAPQMQMGEPDADGASGTPLFTVFSVDAAQIAAGQGVQGTFFPAQEAGSTSVPTTVGNSANLAFDWGAEPPFPPPFNARWVGLLLVPEAGNYRFFVDLPGGTNGANSENGVSLHLDGRRLLDSGVGVTERQESLARGAYRLELLYHSGEIGSETDRGTGTGAAAQGFEILWQPPGGPIEAIPPELLRNTVGAGDGLVGTYFANDAFSGPALTVRKDPLVGAVAELPQPYSVRWSGLVAAARAGEYLFGGVSTGQFRIAINGRTVANKEAMVPITAPAGAMEGAGELDSRYAEGLIYLPMGWHTVEIDYAPRAEETQAVDGLQLFWQPPGGTPDRLPNRYLTSAMSAAPPTTLPAPPALSDPSLGHAGFALTVAPEFRNPQTLVPPDLLPPLDAQMVWQSGSCGSGDLQFDGGRGVAVDSVGGRVYVADSGNRRLAVYGLEGTLLSYVTSEQFQEPFDVDLLPAAEGEPAVPLVLDALAQQIWRIDMLDGDNVGESPLTPLPLGTSFYRPRGFGVDAFSGVIGVADTGGGRTVLLSPEGDVLVEFGGRETAMGRGQPVDVLFAGGRFWGITAEDGRLWRLDTSLPGSTPGLLAVQPANTFDAPHFGGLPDGSFFLTDPARRTILYYTAEGQPVRQWPLSDAFVLPVGIGAAFADGAVENGANGMAHVAVTDSAACTVSLWRVGL